MALLLPMEANSVGVEGWREWLTECRGTSLVGGRAGGGGGCDSSIGQLCPFFDGFPANNLATTAPTCAMPPSHYNTTPHL